MRISEVAKARKRGAAQGPDVLSVTEAIDKWLDISEKEGRDGRDPISTNMLIPYECRGHRGDRDFGLYPDGSRLRDTRCPGSVDNKLN